MRTSIGKALKRDVNSSNRSVRRAAMIKLYPSFANVSEMAAPNPELAPVINAYPYMLQK